ncbi:MAG: hypothetical protein JWN74_464 [Acidobacteriaceae bacterium]|nr:hypothetical protein [Acidobacteriaceae bacterium]
MAYVEDLSSYTYYRSIFNRPGTRTVGWLGRGRDFEKLALADETLDLIWQYCKVSVAQLRGVHECEFCPPGDSFYAERSGEKLLLGTSEIRVFGKDKAIYAAPTLIYHYVAIHHYKPPDEFLIARGADPA